MAKINILPAKVYNRIAAGEVVERPYSVVKELVENSIDAGATEIEIFVENGGKDLIRIIDNGSGIERDDLHAVFLPHATSKIAKAEDLANIMTLGFRGEAVASIASVSQMTVTSKTENGKRYELSCNGGDMGEIKEVAGANKGTDVKVEGLFYKTPVRYNFLKSEKGEEADITTFVSRFILNRSDIAFTYYVNGKKVLQSFGGGDEEAMVGVYGATILDNCYQINAEKNGISIRGYIGNQNFYKSNKSYQSVFLNGRYIQNETIATAINSAYSSYLMKRQYPFYVLHITMSPQIVDVNVHPNKTNVRFANNQMVYGSIYSVVSSVLDGNSRALEYVVNSPVSKKEEPTAYCEPIPQETKKFERKESSTLSDMILNTGNTEEKAKKSASVFGFDNISYKEEKKTGKDISEYPPDVQKGIILLDDIPPYDPSKEEDLPMATQGSHIKDPKKLLEYFPELSYKRVVLELNDNEDKVKQKEENTDYFEENKRYLKELDKKREQKKINVAECSYQGKLFNTYLLYEYADEVYIIDQHAAHERLIYDRLREKMKNRTIVSQSMFCPFELKVNAFEAGFLRERMQDILDMGFDIRETRDNFFEVFSVPADLTQINLTCFFNDILADLHVYRSIKLEEILKDKLASAACKAAIKGGMDITQEDAMLLLEQMDGDMGLKCPHGRPVVVKMTKMQLEKMFKRIV